MRAFLIGWVGISNPNRDQIVRGPVTRGDLGTLFSWRPRDQHSHGRRWPLRGSGYRERLMPDGRLPQTGVRQRGGYLALDGHLQQQRDARLLQGVR